MSAINVNIFYDSICLPPVADVTLEKTRIVIVMNINLHVEKTIVNFTIKKLNKEFLTH